MAPISRVSRGSVVGGLALVVALMLAGCTSNPVASPPVEPSAPAEAEPAASSAPTPTATVPAGIPVDLACDQVITPEQLYGYNPNFGADPGYTVATDSVAADMVELQGVACGWLNQTSNDTIEVALAHLAPADIEARKNELVTSSNIVPTYAGFSDEGYFDQADGIGSADVFVGEFWIHADAASDVFFEPGDAEQFLSAVAGNIAG